MTNFDKLHRLRKPIAILIVFGSLLLAAASAQAVPYVGRVRFTSDYYGVDLWNGTGYQGNKKKPWLAFGDAGLGSSGTLMIQGSHWDLQVLGGQSDTSQWTTGSGEWLPGSVRTYVMGGHPGCLAPLGPVMTPQMPATPYGAPGVNATVDSAYCGYQVGMNDGTLAPGGGPGAWEWCWQVGDPNNSAPCTLTDGNGNPLPVSQQNLRARNTPGAAQFGGAIALMGVYRDGIIMTAASTPGAYLVGWFLNPASAWGGQFGDYVQTSGAFTHLTLGWNSPMTFTMWGAPWSTGVASGRGYISYPSISYATTTFNTRTGYDNRTSMFENGGLQMVTGTLMAATYFGSTSLNAGNLMLQIEFVPEPVRGALLAAGLLALPVAYRLRNRKR